VSIVGIDRGDWISRERRRIDIAELLGKVGNGRLFLGGTTSEPRSMFCKSGEIPEVASRLTDSGISVAGPSCSAAGSDASISSTLKDWSRDLSQQFQSKKHLDGLFVFIRLSVKLQGNSRISQP